MQCICADRHCVCVYVSRYCLLTSVSNATPESIPWSARLARWPSCNYILLLHLWDLIRSMLHPRSPWSHSPNNRRHQGSMFDVKCCLECFAKQAKTFCTDTSLLTKASKRTRKVWQTKLVHGGHDLISDLFSGEYGGSPLKHGYLLLLIIQRGADRFPKANDPPQPFGCLTELLPSHISPVLKETKLQCIVLVSTSK